MGASFVAKLLRRKRGLKIYNNINAMLKMRGLARDKMNKKGKEKAVGEI